MGSPAAPTSGETMQAVMGDVSRNLPKLVQSISGQMLPYDVSSLGAAQATSPAYNTLANTLSGQTAMADANNSLNVLQGPGTQIASTNQNINKMLDPQFYTGRTQAGQGYSDLLTQLNPNNPNPAAARDVLNTNQATGNTGNNSQTTSVANALQYGNEDLQRSAAFNNALSGLTNFMGGSFAPATSPYGQPTSTNASSNSVNTAGQGATGIGMGLLQPSAQAAFQQNDINAMRPSTLSEVESGVNTASNLISSATSGC